MTALFTVRLPEGLNTVPFTDVPLMIAEAKYGRRDLLDDDALELFGADWRRAEVELESAVKRGEVEVLDSSFYPLRPSARLERALIVVDVLGRYLARINGALEITDPEPRDTPSPAPVVEVEAWKTLARNKAFAIIKRDKERDLYPPQESIADEIAREFRNAIPQTVGAGGKPLSGSYIKRHALKGINSAIAKQVSTAKRRGK